MSDDKRNIQVSVSLIDQLKREGNMGETYDEVLKRLMEELKTLRATNGER